ncbi:MAG: type III-A CRISPR-associated protein Csm2 [Saprospiraceae bacterium]|nr:type III-A CRISPR-associated protein Csm2 [Saprospiraceae bacterium]
MSDKSKSLDPAWIKNSNGLNRDALLWAQKFGKFLASYDKENRQKQLSTAQIRRFFGQLKRLQAQGYTEENRTDLLMLSPQLAYAVGRDKRKTKYGMKDGSKIGHFYREVKKAIDAVDHEKIEEERKYFKNLVNLVEAIVAYHRYEGGE